MPYTAKTLKELKRIEKLTPAEAKKYKPCPLHGRAYLVRQSHAVFCYKETPGEFASHCFHHVAHGRGGRLI